MNACTAPRSSLPAARPLPVHSAPRPAGPLARVAALALALLVGLGPITPLAHAQTGIVHDPINWGVHLQAFKAATDALKTARDSLGVVTSTLNEVRSVVRQGQELLRIIGNPAALLNELGLGEVVGLLRSVQELNDLGRRTFQQVVGLADEVKSLTDPNHNYFSNYRNLSTFVNGMSRDTGRYKPFAIMETQFGVFNDVVEKDRKVQTDTAKQMADLTKRLQGAKTENERANITAAMTTVRAAQAQSSHQVNAAGAQMQGASAAFSAAREKDKELRTEDEELLVARAAQEAKDRDSRTLRRLGFGN